jgi:hypothetical protein
MACFQLLYTLGAGFRFLLKLSKSVMLTPEKRSARIINVGDVQTIYARRQLSRLIWILMFCFCGCITGIEIE